VLLVLVLGLIAGPAVASGPADPGTAPIAAEAPDPQLLPAPGPDVAVPDRIRPGTDLGARISEFRGKQVPRPSHKGGTWTARILVRTAVRRKPAGHPFWVAKAWAKWSGGMQQLMVLGSRVRHGEQWLKVRLPNRPNTASGWLPRDRVLLRRSPNYLVVDRSSRTLTIYGNRGRRKARFPVVVGKRSTPTPVGLFALYDRVRQVNPRGFIGPWAVPLTAHSTKLKRYDGGPGLVALHGRDGASFYDPLGSARSHGCIRMNNSRIRQIIKLKLGTAVRVRP